VINASKELTAERKQYQVFLVSVSLIIALGLSGVFLGLAVRTRDLINDEILASARSHFKGIQVARKWNASYGGVYVLKKEGVESNPFLENPDIETVDGRILTLRNPALMTREISEISESEDLYRFRITSLDPVNPANEPNEFERKALMLFEKGEKEYYEQQESDEGARFIYMAPLFVDKQCLVCHSKQGYEEGQVRGGISVSVDIGKSRQRLRENMYAIVLFTISTITISLAFLIVFTRKLAAKLDEARKQIIEIAITDGLTGLYNRRHLSVRFEEEIQRSLRLGKTLSCILSDIDRFKPINDNFGHLAGDVVLKDIATLMHDAVRAYDIVGRFGGDEFLVILPDTEIAAALEFAERLRVAVKEKVAPDGRPITMSFGVTSLPEGNETLHDMLKRADERLYEAKAGGRDRVCCSPDQ